MRIGRAVRVEFVPSVRGVTGEARSCYSSVGGAGESVCSRGRQAGRDSASAGKACWWAALGVVIMLAGAGAGCASYRDRPLSVEASVAEFDTRSLADPGLQQFVERHWPGPEGDSLPPWPPASWGLRQLTLAAIYFHPDLEVARAQVAVAEAGRRTAGQRPNPVVSVTPGYNTTSAGISPWLVNFSLDVPLETAGKRRYRLVRAQHLAQAANLRWAEAVWQVQSGVRQALFEVQAASRTQAILSAQTKALEALMEVLEHRVEAGVAVPLEAAVARANRDAARLRLETARQQEAEARVTLAQAVGVPAHALADATLSFPASELLRADLTGATVRREALLTRPDLLATLAEYGASQAALQLEIARQYPDVHLNPGYEFDQGDNKWMLGLSLELPVLNQNQGPIAEAVARRREAAAHFQATQARIVGEIDRAMAGYQAAQRQSAVARTLETDQQERRRLTRVLFDAGEVDRLTLATAEAEFAAGEQARLEAWIQAQEAQLALENAVRRPLPELPAMTIPASRPKANATSD